MDGCSRRSGRDMHSLKSSAERFFEFSDLSLNTTTDYYNVIFYYSVAIISGQLSDRFGGEKLLVVALLLWSACTALTPAAAELGTAPLLAIRVALGAGEVNHTRSS